jgi:hypothetical protein
VLRWLDGPNPSVTHNHLLAEHHHGTGQWFLELDVFKKWLETSASILWIKGMRMCQYHLFSIIHYLLVYRPIHEFMASWKWQKHAMV